LEFQIIEDKRGPEGNCQTKGNCFLGMLHCLVISLIMILNPS